RRPQPPLRRPRSHQHASLTIRFRTAGRVDRAAFIGHIPPHKHTMERALRNRLTFGPIMLAVLFLLLWLDERLQYWTRPWMLEHFGVKGGVGGIGLLAILAAINPLATGELATLLTAEKVRPYRIISGCGS